VTTAWIETDISYTDKPAVGAIAVSTVTTITGGTWVTFNVTTLVLDTVSVAVAFTSASFRGRVRQLRGCSSVLRP
jgi:hypothetical protein